jgi:hypothetical protein
MKLSNEGMNIRIAISRKDNLYLIPNDSPHDVNRPVSLFLSLPVSTLISSSYKFMRLFQLRAQLGLRTVPPNLAEAIANCLDKLEDLLQRSASPTPGRYIPGSHAKSAIFFGNASKSYESRL